MHPPLFTPVLYLRRGRPWLQGAVVGTQRAALTASVASWARSVGLGRDGGPKWPIFEMLPGTPIGPVLRFPRRGNFQALRVAVFIPWAICGTHNAIILSCKIAIFSLYGRNLPFLDQINISGPPLCTFHTGSDGAHTRPRYEPYAPCAT